jgi:hypothetical protein
LLVVVAVLLGAVVLVVTGQALHCQYYLELFIPLLLVLAAQQQQKVLIRFFQRLHQQVVVGEVLLTALTMLDKPEVPRGEPLIHLEDRAITMPQ